jgi:hypothetical protein
MARRKTYPIKGGAKKRKPGDAVEEVSFKRDGRLHKEKYLKWWLEPTGMQAVGSLWQWIDRQRSTWSIDAINDLIAEAIYSDAPIAAGGRIGEGGRYIGLHSGMNPINKIKSLVDTGTSHLCENRAMPVISADDATYTEKRFAREQSRVLRRKMGDGDMDNVQPDVIRDALIRGTAWGKICRYSGDTQFERVPSYEIVYDHREALYGMTTWRAHVRPENRDKMLALYPWCEKQILAALPFMRIDPWMTYTYTGPNLADMIEVAEAWHPPSAPGADDGQYLLAIRGGCLNRAPWYCQHDQLRCFYWTPPTRGTGRGTGLVVEQAAAQQWVNDILMDAREGIRQGSQLKIFQSRNLGANPHHLRARHPAVIEVDGDPNSVQYVAPDPVSKQAWSIAFQMLQQMDQTSGIPTWASGGTSPLGADPAAKALETMQDIKSKRFANVETKYQQWRVAIGRGHIDLARMMHDEANGKVEKKFPEQAPFIKKDELAAWIRDNEWPDVDIDGGDYHLTLEPENFIIGERGGKLEQVNQAAKAGLIPDPSMTAELFDEPDLARFNRSNLGPVRRIQECMSGLADPRVPYIDVAPDPEMNLALADLIARGELEFAKAEKAGDEIVQRFRDFRNDVQRLQQLATAGANASPSLPGAQANNIIAQPNAASLLPGGPPAAPAGPGPGPGPAPAPGTPPMGMAA